MTNRGRSRRIKKIPNIIFQNIITSAREQKLYFITSLEITYD